MQDGLQNTFHDRLLLENVRKTAKPLPRPIQTAVLRELKANKDDQLAKIAHDELIHWNHIKWAQLRDFLLFVIDEKLR